MQLHPAVVMLPIGNSVHGHSFNYFKQPSGAPDTRNMHIVPHYLLHLFCLQDEQAHGEKRVA